MSRILFVTGTDTGVGKTILTASLLLNARRAGTNALAMKPFCSGGREDVELLRRIQGETPAWEEVCPFYFAMPVAPLVAARAEQRRVELPAAVAAIQAMARRAELLIVEGAGGLMSPLGEGFDFLDLICRFERRATVLVLVVAPNRLGAINQARLTLEMLRRKGVRKRALVLMEQGKPEGKGEAASRSNLRILKELLDPVRVYCFPYLGRCEQGMGGIRGIQEKLEKNKKVLARDFAPDTLCARSSEPVLRDRPRRLKKRKRSLTVGVVGSKACGHD